jgi:hypothetical protein
MSSTTIKYMFNKERLSIMNIINYLCILVHFKTIPKFSVNFTNNEMEIITIYSVDSTDKPLNGYNIITYNFITKKWTTRINIQSIVNNEFINNICGILINNFPYLIDNNLLKVIYQNEYIEYILESDSIEDILEPSFISFNDSRINPREIIISSHVVKFSRIEYLDSNYDSDNAELNKRIFVFQSIKKLYYLPEEMWNVIYSFI